MKRHYSHGLACFVILVCTLFQAGQFFSVKAAQNYQITITGVDATGYPTIQTHISIIGPNGIPLAGLGPANFSIAEDGMPVSEYKVQEIEQSESPITFVIAVDTSGSMSGKPLEDTAQAITALMDDLNDQDQIAVVSFNDQPQLIVPATNDREKIITTLSGLSGTGKTALWDGIHLSLNTLYSHESGKSAVIVISDGADTASLLRLEDIASEANIHHLPIFTIGFGEVDRTSLSRLSKLTGAESFILPDSSVISDKFTEILNTMRPEYLLSYPSQSLADGKEHQVSVGVNIQNTTIQDDTSFIIPAAELSASLRGISDGQKIGIGAETILSPIFPAEVAVSKVEFVLDRVVLAELTASPFEYKWTPDASDAGEHTLNIRVTDLVGNKVEIFVPIVVEPPITLTILTPKANEKVSGEVSVQVQATGIENIASVKTFVDDNQIQELLQAPYEFSFSADSLSPGLHTLKVIATDIKGQSAQQQVSINSSIPRIWVVGGISLGLAILLILVIAMSVRNRNRIRAAAIGETVEKAALPISIRNSLTEQDIIVRKREVHTEISQPTDTEELLPLATISIVQKNTAQEEIFKVWRDITWLGSTRSDDGICLAEPGIPSKLALIEITKDARQLVPMSASIRISVNHQQITDAVNLQDGDKIEIGNSVMTIYFA